MSIHKWVLYKVEETSWEPDIWTGVDSDIDPEPLLLKLKALQVQETDADVTYAITYE